MTNEGPPELNEMDTGKDFLLASSVSDRRRAGETEAGVNEEDMGFTVFIEFFLSGLV